MGQRVSHFPEDPRRLAREREIARVRARRRDLEELGMAGPDVIRQLSKDFSYELGAIYSYLRDPDRLPRGDAGAPRKRRSDRIWTIERIRKAERAWIVRTGQRPTG